MTTHDREPEVLLKTLRGLWRSGLGEAELIVVDDRSAMDYSWVREYCLPRFSSVKWARTGEYEGFRSEGYGNPAHAFNVGLAIATKERLIVMSSDVEITPGVVKSMDRFWTPDVLYTPRIVDMDSGQEYCGEARIFPAPWFLAMPTGIAQQIGGWDEKFLDGLCYEDNDFLGRLCLYLGEIKCDWKPIAYHQSHPQPAYALEDLEIRAANQRNRDYCMTKWKGIPFSIEFAPFNVIRRPDPSGCSVLLKCQNVALRAHFFPEAVPADLRSAGALAP